MADINKIEVGDKYNFLTVIAYAGRIKYDNKNNRKHWICKCDCGQEKICNESLLKSGKIKSCGCIKFSDRNRQLKQLNLMQWYQNNFQKNICEIWDYTLNLTTPDKINCYELEKILHFICPIHGKYSKKLKEFIKNSECTHCLHVKKSNNILAIKYPEIKNIWSQKNNFTPYDITCKFSKKVWLKCINYKHDDYLQNISNAIKGNFDCPVCVKEMKCSKAQYFVNQYLEHLGYNVLHEYTCNIIANNPITNRSMPYDNEIPEINLIIEVHGVQHYHENSSWNKLYAKQHNVSLAKAFYHQQYRDTIKRNYALINGYNYLEIPYWTIYNNTFKTLIDDTIKEIVNIY